MYCQASEEKLPSERSCLELWVPLKCAGVFVPLETLRGLVEQPVRWAAAERSSPAGRTLCVASAPVKHPAPDPAKGMLPEHRECLQGRSSFRPLTRSELSMDRSNAAPPAARAALNCLTHLVNNAGVTALRALMVCCCWMPSKCDQPAIVAVSFHILDSDSLHSVQFSIFCLLFWKILKACKCSCVCE